MNYYSIARYVKSSFSLFASLSAVVKRAALFVSLSVVLLLFGGVSVNAAPGDLDNSFGSGGKVTTPVGTTRDFAQAVVIQTDGKIVVAGNAQGDFAVVRYNADGTLDTAFGANGSGKVLTDIGGRTQDEASAIALQSDGRIVVAGSTTTAGNTDFALVRYLPNGTLDGAFGAGGKVVTPIGSGSDSANALTIQPNGKIIVAGSSDLNTLNAKFALAGYNSDGSLDASFGTGGKVSVSVSSSGGIAQSVALQPDAKILIGGGRNVEAGQSVFSKFALLRLNTDGSVDANFGTAGIVTTSFGDNRYGSISDITVQPDGRIIVSGGDNGSSDGNTAVVRYLSNGSLDSSFGTGGIVITRVGSVASTGETVNLQTNGKIVVTGDSYSGSNNDFGVLRLNADGMLDTSFGTSGKVVTSIGSRDDSVRDAALQADGKIVVIGNSENAAAGFNEDFAVVRYLGDTVITRPAAFDFDGDRKTDYAVYRPSEGIWYLMNSQTGFSTTRFGLENDKLVPADYDGDGKADIAVYRNGIWYLLRSQAGFAQLQFGLSNDVPVPFDFDGDGKAEIAVFRPSSGQWWMQRSSDNQVTVQTFGVSEDKPVPADYDGDGKADLAIFRPSDGNWWIKSSASGAVSVTKFGVSGDLPVTGDYDGDGKADVAIWRPSSGDWWVQGSGGAMFVLNFGLSGDKPVPGDYDGDGKNDLAVWRPSDRIFYALKSGSGNQYSVFQFGLSSDVPVANAFVP